MERGLRMLNKKAVVEKIGTDLVTLLIGEEEQERIVSMEELPSGIKEGDWVTVTLDETGRLITIQIDEQETLLAKNRIQDKMDALRSRSKSNFGNK